MPFEHFEWQQRIKAVERQYSAAQFAIDRLTTEARSNPTLLPRDMKQRDLATAARELESTYLIRLFAEFESAVRQFWPTIRTKDPPVRIRDLIESLASNRKIDSTLVQRTHEVREFRNALVHERNEEVSRVAISAARGYLCRFLSRLR